MSSHPGIYLHIPFCVKKCRYCDFYSVADTQRLQAFVDALCLEIDAMQPPGDIIDSIYFGGGTPSILPVGAVQRILEAVFRKFVVSDDAEITLETNPGTVSAEAFAGFRHAGINRLNIGVQSFQDKQLAFLGRIHSAGQGRDAIVAARDAGFENIGIDLMYAIPGQTAAMWKKNLQAACDLHPDHLSCYMLTYEPGTPLTEELKAKKFKPVPESRVASMFQQTVKYLEGRGYLFYEVSNFAKTPDLRSRHNRKYWRHASYIGFGPSAHSFSGNCRSWNVRSVDQYVKRITSGNSPIADSEMLDEKQMMTESIFLGLRRREGICLAEFENRYGSGFSDRFAPAIDKNSRRGFLAADENCCRLTLAGMCYLDTIAAEFIDLV